MDFVILLVSLVIIVISADKLIDSSSKIARHYGVPVFIIGVSIIAFGTSAPELVVGVISSLKGDNALSYGNIIGSCINNITLNLGVASIIATIVVSDKLLKREMLMLTLIELVLIGMSLNGELSKIDGIILLTLGIAFIIYLVKSAKDGTESEDNDSSKKLDKKEVVKKWFVMFISLGLLIFSGQLIVESSQGIAEGFGLEQSVIGLTLIALGTTMPELVAGIAAARRKESEIILGNVVGSNVFNILVILGSTSVIKPISIKFINLDNIYTSLIIELAFMFIINILAYIIMYKKRKITKVTGIFFLLLYVIYMAKQIYFI